MNRWFINTRLLATFFLVAALPLIGLAWFYLTAYERSLSETALRNLSSIADKKSDQIDDYVNQRLRDARVHVRRRSVTSAIPELERAFRQGGLSATYALDQHYRTGFVSLVETGLYYDVLLIDVDGNVLFSVLHESDLGTNLNTGPYRDSTLAQGFRRAVQTLDTDFTTFEAYAPSNNKAASFVITPVVAEGRLVGVMAMQVNLDDLTRVVTDKTGLGRSGEAVLAQQVRDRIQYMAPLNHLPKAAFRHHLPASELAPPMRRALAGEHGMGLSTDYAGIGVIAVWRYLPALHWGMVVKVDAEEAFAPVRRIQRISTAILIVFLLLSGLLAIFIHRRFSRTDEALRVSEANLAAAQQIAGIGSWERNFADNSWHWSAETYRIFGLQPDSPGARWENFLELIHPDDKAKVDQSVRNALDGGGSFDIEYRINLADGTQKIIHSLGEVVQAEDGKQGWMRGTVQDITERKRDEESMQLAATIYQSSAEGVIVTDENNLIIDVNPAFTQQTGYTLEEVIGKNPKILHSGRQDKAFYQKMWQSIQLTGHWQGEIWNLHKDGTPHAKFYNISVIRRADGRIHRYVAQFFDITDRKAKEELIWQQANFDPLTGLPNRRLFHDRLEQEIKKAHRVSMSMALLFIDLDRFKEVNDTLGHAKGDLLLMEASRRVKSCVRDTDTVARLGGDEFTVILPEYGERGHLERIAQNIIDELSRPFDLGTPNLSYVTASIGITLYPEDASDLQGLLKHADQAMYAAKAEGRNRFGYFTESMQKEAQEKQSLTNDLRLALARNELQVYYQPILDLASGRTVKAEALLRWQHPERGAIGPSAFIPLAEESGLIHEIGEWVFQEAIDSIARWRNRFGRIVQVSVNKSPAQFELAERVRWMDKLASAGLPGSAITVEITEGLLLRKSAKVMQRLLEFRNSGIEVSIDDFGTGFSALSYLKQFDIDYIKIDRSFINDLSTNASDKALTEAIIVMAHKLGIKTIAEGVETQAQSELLLGFGCDYVQGFLYAQPLPAPEFEALLENDGNVLAAT